MSYFASEHFGSEYFGSEHFGGGGIYSPLIKEVWETLTPCSLTTELTPYSLTTEICPDSLKTELKAKAPKRGRNDCL